MDDFSEHPKPNPSVLLIAGNFAARNHPGLEPRVLIRVLRRGAGLSQSDVGRGAGLTQSRLSEIESGRVDPRWSEIRDLLTAMRCEPVLLAAGKGYRENPRGRDARDWEE